MIYQMETVIISNVAGMCSHCGEWRNPVKSTVRWVRFWMGLFFGGFFFFFCGTCSIQVWLLWQQQRFFFVFLFFGFFPPPPRRISERLEAKIQQGLGLKCNLPLSQACTGRRLVQAQARHFFEEASAGGASACSGTWCQRVRFSSRVSQLETNGPGRRVRVRRSSRSSLCVEPSSGVSSGVSRPVAHTGGYRRRPNPGGKQLRRADGGAETRLQSCGCRPSWVLDLLHPPSRRGQSPAGLPTDAAAGGCDPGERQLGCRGIPGQRVLRARVFLSGLSARPSPF